MRPGPQFLRTVMVALVLWTGCLVSPAVAPAATYYVATTGQDTYPGTQAAPFRTLKKGLSVLRSGDTLYLRQGTYRERITTYVKAIPGGTSWANATRIMSYPNELATLAPDENNRPVLDISNAGDHYLIFDRLVLDASRAQYAISMGAKGAHHIRVQNSDIKNARGVSLDGITYRGGTNIQLAGSFNEVVNSKIHHSQHSYGFYITGNNHIVDGNEIYNNAGYAIQIYEGHYPTVTTDNHIIRNNRMYNNGFARRTAALTMWKGSNCLFYNNLIYNNFGGISVGDYSTNLQIYNNSLYKNGWGIQIPIRSKGTIIQNNILYQNGSTITDKGVDTIQSNNLTTDPQFVNASTNEFALQSMSPAIDAGITLSAVPTDLNGMSRPQGTHHDIGAYEYPQIPVPSHFRIISVMP